MWTEFYQKILEDRNVYWDAKGLFIYMANQEKGKRFKVEDLFGLDRHSNDSKSMDELREMLKELVQNDYVKQEERKDENGELVHEYFVSNNEKEKEV